MDRELTQKDHELKWAQFQTEQIAKLSHDMKAPLTLAKAAVDNFLIVSNAGLSKKQEELLEILQRQIAYLIDMNHSVFDASLLELGKQPDHFKKMPITPLLQEVVRNFKLLCDCAHIRLQLISSVDLGEIYGDAHMLIRVFNNILQNALQFACSVITVRAWQVKNDHEKNIHIVIEDDGPGISPSDTEQIFEKYFSLRKKDRTTKKGEPHLGLGLTICKKIIDAHGAKIWAEKKTSNDGGAALHMLFPLYNEEKTFEYEMKQQWAEAKKQHDSLGLIALTCATSQDLSLLEELMESVWRGRVFRHEDKVYSYVRENTIFLLLKTDKRGLSSAAEHVSEALSQLNFHQAFEANPSIDYFHLSTDIDNVEQIFALIKKDKAHANKESHDY